MTTCKPGGVFSMYNYYRSQWLVDRYAGTLDEHFDRPPCVDTGSRPGRGSRCSSSPTSAYARRAHGSVGDERRAVD